MYNHVASTDMTHKYQDQERVQTLKPMDNNIFGSEPIADLFPHATVMFIDIAGFTAWSSEREPTQVFSLLENLYHAFDEVGRKLGIFKVETIGDSYVAVAGLPSPREDHALGTLYVCS
jgi:class 3 adenylate cyclase